MTVPPRETLADLLGGRSAAFDASLPPAAFVAGYLAGGRSVGWGAVTALLAAGAVAAWRLFRGAKPRAVLVGVLVVAVASAIALYTGRAVDFFLARIFVNAASALAFAVSIVLRWPLLGVVVGLVLGQKGRWRKDPDLLRAYSRASWLWVGMYALRVAVFLPLWSAGRVVASGAAQTLLSWPLLALVLASSWWVIQRSLPPEHPGLRVAETPGGDGDS